MRTFRIPSTGLVVGLDKLREGYVIVGSYSIDEHHKEVLKARRYRIGATGIFVYPDSPIEVGTVSVPCGRRGCVKPRCAAAEAKRISSALTHVFRATGNAVMAVTVPRLATASEYEAALWAVIDAGSVIASHSGVEGVYGLVAVPEWHLEGRTADRAAEVITQGDRASYPYHMHATLSVTLSDDAEVAAIEAAYTQALRDRLDETVYAGSLDWSEAAVDIAAIKAKTLADSVPVGLLKPLGSLGNSDWYKLDYVVKNLDARTHTLHGGNAGAWGVERQRAICDALLVPGDRTKRTTPLRGVKLDNYGWLNAYAYPVGDDENRVEHRFMSQGSTWTRKALEDDAKRRRKGFVVEDDRTYDPSTGWIETVTHRGFELSEVITSEVIDADLTVTVGESLRRARLEARVRLMGECVRLGAIRRISDLKALYAALLDMKKAARVPRGCALVLSDVQSTAQRARAPPRHTCRPPVILSSIKDILLLLNFFYLWHHKSGKISTLRLRSSPSSEWIPELWRVQNQVAADREKPPNLDWLGGRSVPKRLALSHP